MFINQTAQLPSTTTPLQYHPETETYRTQFEPTDDARASQVIVEAIAVIEARELRDDSPVLYDYIDPDALNALFCPRAGGMARPSCTVTFAFDTYDICVNADGWLVIHSRQS